MASESAVKRRPAPTADELADTILDRILANDHTHHANPDAPCVSCEDEDVDHAFISTQITWVITAAREAERERWAKLMEENQKEPILRRSVLNWARRLRENAE